MIFHFVLIYVSNILKYFIIAEITFVKQCTVVHCSWQEGGGRKTEIWQSGTGGEHKKWTRIGDKSRHNIGPDLLFSLFTRRDVFPYFRVLYISYSWALQIIWRQKWKRQLYYKPYSTYQIRYLPFWATSKDIFLSRNRFSVWEPQYFTGREQI